MEKQKNESQSVAKRIRKAYRGSEGEAAAHSLPQESGADSVSELEVMPSESSGARDATTKEPTGSDVALIQELDRMGKALEEEKAKSAELQNRYLRLVADLENFRKRAVREKEELSKVISGAFAEDLFPVVDNFRIGLQSAEGHPEARKVVDGFRMVYGQINELLRNKGVTEVCPKNEPFDPRYQECVAHLPHPEIPENHVIETIRMGYRMDDRLLRAAAVTVSNGSSAS